MYIPSEIIKPVREESYVLYIFQAATDYSA